MQVKTTMEICGLGIPYEEQNYYRSASNRIHVHTPTTRNYWERCTDKLDFVAMVHQAVENAQGVLRAVEAPGGAKNENGAVLTPEKVSLELSILADDLEEIATAAENAIAAGKVPSEMPIENAPTYYVAKDAKTLRELSWSMREKTSPLILRLRFGSEVGSK